MSSEWLPIADIVVGNRLREDMGDIAGLAKSIDTYGLLHPVVIDADRNLVAGGRRLRAMESLGWTKAEVRQFEEMTPDERRVLELEENLRRKDLTAFERSRNLTDLAIAAVEVIDKETGEVFTDSVKTGRPPKARVAERVVAERIAVPENTIRDAKKHVTAAERYPALQKPDWPQYRAMEAASQLDALPDEEREDVHAVLSEPGVPADTAITILSNWKQKPKEERDAIREGLKSSDDRDRSAAKAALVNEPPPPNRIVTALEDIEIKQMSAAIRRMNTLIESYPSDPYAGEIKALVIAQRAVNASVAELIRKIEGKEHVHAQAAAD
jgi:ParB-like chromosome segregation protein Spo0J